jgi:hypothetical protein
MNKVKIKKYLSKLVQVVGLFVKYPRFESYIHRQAKLNEDYFSIVKSDAAYGTDKHLEGFYFKPIPKVIWIFWWQGVEDAPPLVRKCIKSWEKNNADWDIRILSHEDVKTYVKMPNFSTKLSKALFSDILRLRLLSGFGGVWVDATVYCHRPLGSWLPYAAHSGLFMFKEPGPSREIENWFIACDNENNLVRDWSKNLEAYLNSSSKIERPYFITFYIFQWLVKSSETYKDFIKRSSFYCAGPALLMWSVVCNRTDISVLKSYIDAGLAMSKLSWKNSTFSDAEFDQIVKQLE